MMTTGEVITNTLLYFMNIGSDAVATDQKLRDRARFYLTTLAKDVWDLAPFWFRLKSGGTVAVSVGDEEVAVPSDFSHQGAEMQIYLQNFPYYRLNWKSPDELYSYRRTVGSTLPSGRPTVYTLQGRTALGIPKMQFWPRADISYTLIFDGYVRLMPDLVDRPMAPLTADDGAGLLSAGAYQWKVTFVTASGETEGGAPSTSLTLAVSHKAALTNVGTSPCRSVTSRKIYRTAAGGTEFKLAGTISDNTTTTFSDNTPDASLGATAPTVAGATTGLEQFPEDAQERLLVKGLRAYMATAQGDLRDNKWYEDWRKDVQRFWGEYKQGQNEPTVMPRFGVVQGIRGGYWPRWN